MEIPKQLVEICTNNTSTGIRLNQNPFGKISKSGDGGGSGDTLHIKMKEEKVTVCYTASLTQNMISTYYSLLRFLFSHIPKTYGIIDNPTTLVLLVCFKTQILNFGVAQFRKIWDLMYYQYWVEIH